MNEKEDKILEAKTTIIESEKELIDLMNKDKVPPHVAVQHAPQNKAVLEAAYKKDPSSLKYADKETINALGIHNIIQITDILSAFSITMPTDFEKRKIKEIFEEAMVNKKWAEVIKVCNKFWFEKPTQADKDTIIKTLLASKQWNEIYRLEKAAKKEEYQLILGPLSKSLETYELEELARKMMKDDKFTVKNHPDGDYFEFSDGTQFNWTKIQANADWQHIIFDQYDFDLYEKFLNSSWYPKSNLDRSKENIYRMKLYNNPLVKDLTQEPMAIPDPSISFAEMQAINIYTGNFYHCMNGLMRDERNKFNYRTAAPDQIRSALIHSVMCSSGLRKAPMLNIPQSSLMLKILKFLTCSPMPHPPVSYRGGSHGNDEQLSYLKAAANQEVIMLDGFISTSMNEYSSFGHKKNLFIFNNLRGMYVAPISQNPDEQEFLVPPSQVKLTNYSFDEKAKKHHFEGSFVCELSKSEFNPFIFQEPSLSHHAFFKEPEKGETASIEVEKKENKSLE